MSFLSNKFKFETKSSETHIANFISCKSTASISMIPDNSKNQETLFGANNFSNIEAFFGISSNGTMNTIAGFNECNINFYTNTVVRGNLIVDGTIMSLGLDVVLDSDDLHIENYNNYKNIGSNVIVQKYEELTEKYLSLTSNNISLLINESYSNIYNLANNILNSNYQDPSQITSSGGAYDDTQFDAYFQTKSADDIREGNNKYIVNGTYDYQKLIIQGDFKTSNIILYHDIKASSNVLSSSYYGDGRFIENILIGDGTTSSLLEGSNLFYKEQSFIDIVNSSNIHASNYINIVSSDINNIQYNIISVSSNNTSDNSNLLYNTLNISINNLSNYSYDIRENTKALIQDIYDTSSNNLYTYNISNILEEKSREFYDYYLNISNEILTNAEIYNTDIQQYLLNISNISAQNLYLSNIQSSNDIEDISTLITQNIYDTYANLSNIIVNDNGVYNILQNKINTKTDNIIDYIDVSSNYLFININNTDENNSNIIKDLYDNKKILWEEYTSEIATVINNSNSLFDALENNTANTCNYIDKIKSSNIALLNDTIDKSQKDIINVSNLIQDTYNNLSNIIDTNYSNIIEYTNNTSNDILKQVYNNIQIQKEQSTAILTETNNNILTNILNIDTNNIKEGTSNFYYTTERFNEYFDTIDYDNINNGTSNKLIVNNVYNSNLYINGVLYTSNLKILNNFSTINTDVYQSGSSTIISSNNVNLLVTQITDNITNNILGLYDYDSNIVFVVKNSGKTGVNKLNPLYDFDVYGDANCEFFIGNASGLTDVNLSDKRTMHVREGSNLYYNDERVGRIMYSSNSSMSNYISAVSNNLFQDINGIMNQSNYISTAYTNLQNSLANSDINISNYNINISNMYINTIQINSENVSNYVSNISNIISVKLNDSIKNNSNYITSTGSVLYDKINTDLINISNYNTLLNSNLTNIVNISNINTSNFITTTRDYILNNKINNGNISAPAILMPIPTIFGSTPTLISNDTYYVSFTSTSGTNTITFTENTICDILVVAGGGSGGISSTSWQSGGGGAGGLIYLTGITLNGTYNITVGAGGNNGNGGNSILTNGTYTQTAIGGGKGGVNQVTGNSGGSGGGGASWPGNGGAGTAGQGNNGTIGHNSPYYGGGGGGAGASGPLTGEGGNGLEIPITGTSIYYAGGGAGGEVVSGGLGGGGSGVNARNGTNGLGGGGGGATRSVSYGLGGSGIVIIKFTLTKKTELDTTVLDINQSNYITQTSNILLGNIDNRKYNASNYTNTVNSNVISRLNVVDLNLKNYITNTSNNLINYCSNILSSSVSTSTTTTTITDIYGGEKILHLNFSNVKLINNIDNTNFKLLNRTVISPIYPTINTLITANNIISGYQNSNINYLNSSNNIYVYNDNDTDCKTVLDKLNNGFLIHFLFKTRYTQNTPIYFNGNSLISFINIKVLFGLLNIKIGYGSNEISIFVNNIILPDVWYVIDIAVFIINGEITFKVYYNRILQNISLNTLVITDGLIGNLPTIVGSTATLISGSTYYVAFTATSGTQTINFPSNTVCDILVVGGGGGGGCSIGSGGGAGGLIYKKSYTFTSGTYNITIGKGGVGHATPSDISNNNGEDTYIKNINNVDIFRAFGGGGGLGQSVAFDNTAQVGNGGSGGGGCRNKTTGGLATQTGIDNFGFNGGNGTNSANSYGAGGGGGADSIGSSATTSYAGNGGSGKQINIRGINEYFAGGGGGCAHLATVVATGGSGIGGNGAIENTQSGYVSISNSTSGASSTGSGGGGGSWSGGGGAGGSGIVIIKYSLNTSVYSSQKALIQSSQYNNALSYSGGQNLRMLFGSSNLIDTYEDNASYVRGATFTNTYFSSNSYINPSVLSPIICNSAYNYGSYSNLIYSSYYASNYDYQFSSNISAINVLLPSFSVNADSSLLIGNRGIDKFNFVLTEIETNVRLANGYYIFMLDLQNEVTADLLIGKHTDNNIDNYFNVANYYNSNLLNTPSSSITHTSNMVLDSSIYIPEGYYRFYTRMLRNISDRNNKYFIAKYYRADTWTGTNYYLNDSNISLRYTNYYSLNSAYQTGSVFMNSNMMINNNTLDISNNMYNYVYYGEAVSAVGTNTNGVMGINNANLTYSTNIITNVIDAIGSAPLKNIIQVSSYNNGTYALFLSSINGYVYACGDNSYGQLGIGTYTATYILKQVKGINGVGFISNVSKICAGGNRSYFITSNDGCVYTTGDNSTGACGINSISTSNILQQVKGVNGVGTISNIIQVAGGFRHSVFLSSISGVTGLYTCGRNTSGCLGINSTVYTSAGDKLTLQQISGFTTVKKIAAGAETSHALRNDGTLYSAGNGDYLGYRYYTATPFNVFTNTIATASGSAINNIIDIASGHFHILVVKNDGSVFSSGQNTSGECGQGTTTTDARALNVKITNTSTNLTNVTSVYAGLNTSFFKLNDGSILGCGDNTGGKLGIGNTTAPLIKNLPIPIYESITPLTPISGVIDIAPSNTHTLFLQNKKTVVNISNYNYNISHSNNGKFFTGNRDISSNLLNIQDFKILNNPLSLTNDYGISNILYRGWESCNISYVNNIYTNRWNETSDYQNLSNMYIYYNEGNVSIGSLAPSLASLEINTNVVRDYKNVLINSIKTNNGIWTNTGVITSSDERIKKNIKDISDDTALKQILSITPKSYNYIDNTKSNIYGFIAQEVKDIIPTAITLNTDTIPNIYKSGILENNIITLDADNSLIEIVRKIDRGTKILLTDAKNNRYEERVLEIVCENNIKIEIENVNNIIEKSIFVYGVIVNDFHTIDKSYIYTLNVCALQEIYRRHLKLREEMGVFNGYDNIMPIKISALSSNIIELENEMLNIKTDILSNKQRVLLEDVLLLKGATEILVENINSYNILEIDNLNSNLSYIKSVNAELITSNIKLVKEYENITDTIRNYTNELMTIKSILQMNNIM